MEENHLNNQRDESSRTEEARGGKNWLQEGISKHSKGVEVAEG